MILYLGKAKITDRHYMRVFFNGAVVLVPISSKEYEDIQLDELQELNQSDFVISCYNKGYDCILKLSLNRKGA